MCALQHGPRPAPSGGQGGCRGGGGGGVGASAYVGPIAGDDDEGGDHVAAVFAFYLSLCLSLCANAGG